jgi:dihydropteroate synthase
VEAGISVGRIAVDPGVGFGKTMADNWRLATRASEVRPEGFGGPVVLGASRKRFLETAPPGDVVLPADWRVRVDRLQSGSKHVRDGASATVTAAAAKRGVEIHRVHDVRLARESLRTVVNSAAP